MAKCSTTELETRIIAEDIDQSRHVPDVYTSRRHWHHSRHGHPLLGEEHTSITVLLYALISHEIHEAQRDGSVTFQLAHNGA